MYERILVPVDGSHTSNCGLEHAIQLAGLTGGRIRLLHVVDKMPYAMTGDAYGRISIDVLALARDSGNRILQSSLDTVGDGGIAVDTVLDDSLSGRLCEHVAKEAMDWHADLIVLGTHGRRGLERALLGSDAEQIARTAPVPILLVRASRTAKVSLQNIPLLPPDSVK